MMRLIELPSGAPEPMTKLSLVSANEPVLSVMVPPFCTSFPVEKEPPDSTSADPEASVDVPEMDSALRAPVLLTSVRLEPSNPVEPSVKSELVRVSDPEEKLKSPPASCSSVVTSLPPMMFNVPLGHSFVGPPNVAVAPDSRARVPAPGPAWVAEPPIVSEPGRLAVVLLVRRTMAVSAGAAATMASEEASGANFPPAMMSVPPVWEKVQPGAADRPWAWNVPPLS